MATKEEKEAKIEMKESVKSETKVEAKAEEKVVEAKEEKTSDEEEKKDMKENPKHLGWNSHQAVVSISYNPLHFTIHHTIPLYIRISFVQTV